MVIINPIPWIVREATSPKDKISRKPASHLAVPAKNAFLDYHSGLSFPLKSTSSNLSPNKRLKQPRKPRRNMNQLSICFSSGGAFQYVLWIGYPGTKRKMFNVGIMEDHIAFSGAISPIQLLCCTLRSSMRIRRLLASVKLHLRLSPPSE